MPKFNPNDVDGYSMLSETDQKRFNTFCNLFYDAQSTAGKNTLEPVRVSIDHKYYNELRFDYTIYSRNEYVYISTSGTSWG